MQEIEMTEDVTIEGMQFSFDIANEEMNRGYLLEDGTPVQTSAGNDIAIEVISPAGTRSVLLSSKQAIFYPAFSFAAGFQDGYVLKDAVFLSNAFYGENAKGTWKIRVLDTGNTNFTFSGGTDNNLEVAAIANNNVNSVLEAVSLRAFGHAGQ